LRKSFAQRYGKNLAVIMLDIDRFKVINDRFGHPAGDKVIVAITATLKGTLRESDGCGRYGGEEFLLILPESGVQDVCFLAERIRLKIEELRIPEIDNLPVTASLGIAVFDPSNPDENLIGIADKALYEAKHSGRNQVVIADDGLKGGVT
ncbi:MAG TPA: GGDEF domain-containing protein, partial [Desulfobacterales bacterium]|nr:GGDEF domain-containing protein [Desulfobacterales bacterium]